MKTIICIAIFLLASFSHSARIEVAYLNKQEEKYDIALFQFKELASVGNKDAQFSIGEMYVKGEGVAKDYVRAYAWMKLSTTKGNIDGHNVVEQLVKILDEDQLAEAESRYQDLLEIYGDKVVESKLFPKLNKTNVGRFRSRKPVYKPMPRYPKKAKRNGLQGTATIEYMIGRDGRTRFHRVVSYTDKAFIDESLNAAKKFRYKPASIDGKRVDVYSNRHRFTYQFSTGTDQKKIATVLGELASKAENGTSVDRFNYALTSNIVRNFLDKNNRNKYGDSFHWLTLAAVDGHPLAKYELGTRVLYGEQCDADDSKSHFWLTSAAKDDVPQAQILLGLERYNGVMFDKNEEEGLFWIKKAADSGNDEAKVRFVAISALLESPLEDNIKLARKYLDSVSTANGFYDMLSYYEAQALLFSVERNFEKAKKFQKKAIKEAKKHKIDTSLLEANMARLKKNEVIDRLVEV